MMMQINLMPLFRIILATLSLILGAVQITYAATAPVTRHEIKQRIIQVSKQNGLPPSLALAVAKVGSDFQPRTLSRGSARGVMQLYPQTVDWVTADDLWKPVTNIHAGVRYLNRLIQRYFGRWELALSHYHSGYALDAPLLTMIEPGSETFVEQVLRWQERYKAQAEIWSDAPAYSYSVDTRAHKPTSHIIATENDLDDFNNTIDMRRLQARRSLDDFSRGWIPNRWSEGP